ncbi:MAG: hypothetical protein WD992_02410 [Candidatus Levyibacteriota bacterium]
MRIVDIARRKGRKIGVRATVTTVSANGVVLGADMYLFSGRGKFTPGVDALKPARRSFSEILSSQTLK